MIRELYMKVSMAMFLYVLIISLHCLRWVYADYQPEKPDSRFVDVAIVGAGAAGTYAAYSLRNSQKTIELFEYSDRIGGRIYTDPALSKALNMSIEFGNMVYLDDHTIFGKLVKELGLKSVKFADAHGENQTIMRYFMRNQSLTVEDVTSGEIPFRLTPEEKANQAHIYQYYLQKLTGQNISTIQTDNVLLLTLQNGTELYKLKIDEALDLVASPEGKAFAKELSELRSFTFGDTSATNLFDYKLGESSMNSPVLGLEEGMSVLPQRLAMIFNETSLNHKVSMNKKLESVVKMGDKVYKLQFRQTRTRDGLTKELQGLETVYAAKVILAIPQFALTKLNWQPLFSGEVKRALRAVRPVIAHIVYMSFPSRWWIENATNPAHIVMAHSLPFGQACGLMQSHDTGNHLLMASFSDGNNTATLEAMNFGFDLIPGSATGAKKVTRKLKDELLTELSRVFGIPPNDIPEPNMAAAYFWTRYPFGGAWTEWRAGYNFSEIASIILRPSPFDDIFIVGSDFAFSQRTMWVEGSFQSVDRLMARFFA